jgi:large subunit ribosomal protein L9
MQIILLQDVEKLGLRGEVVSVADGFARNYLLPRRYAERATPAKVAELGKREERRARQEARTAEQAQGIAETLSKTVLRFEVTAGPTGRLFGSVTPTNIADEIWRARKVRVDRRKIDLAEPIKRIGRYDVPVTIFEDVVVEVKTLVVPEGGELPSEEELAALEAEERAEEQAAAAETEAAEQEVAQVVEELEAEEESAAQPEAEVEAGEDEAVPEPEAEPEAEAEPAPEAEPEAEAEPAPESEPDG